MVSVQTLGTAVIDTGEVRLTPTSARKFAMLLYLCAEPARAVSRTVLHELIFPDQTEKNAKHSLREMVYQLKQIGVALRSGADGIALGADGVHHDYTDVISAPRLDVALVTAATGGFLPGYAPEHSHAYRDWLSSYRAQVTFDLTKALVQEIRRAKAVADWTMTERAARACRVLEPLNEEATVALAEMLTIGGAKSQANAIIAQYMEDVGDSSPELRVQAALLKRRISERAPERYQPAVPSPFVGREREMLALADYLKRAVDGDSQCVVVTGEAGIGKTRLVTELATAAMLQGVRVVRVAARPQNEHHPLGAFVDLVPQLLALPGALGCSPASMAALERLTKHDPATAEDSVASVQQSDVVAASITRAIGDLVDAIASENPLVLWLDDAQWLDEMSLGIIGTLTSVREPRRLLVLMTSRERSTVQNLSRQSASPATVLLAPLERAAAEALVDHALRRDNTDVGDSGSWMIDAAAGNPFYLTSLLNHLRQTGERFTIPASINLLVDQRLATLTETAALVLQTCVLLGKYSTLERIAPALDLPQYLLLGALKQLETTQLIEHDGEGVQPAHWLIADAVRRNVGQIELQQSHRRIADLLNEEATRTQSAGVLWDCGEHWIAAGDAGRAASVIRECSRHALEIGRPREASDMLLRAAVLAPPDLKVALAEEGACMASGALEHELALRGIDILRSAGVAIQHDGLEIVELTAVSVLDTGGMIDAGARFAACFYSPAASDSHRLHIGLALMTLCVHQHDTALAATIFATLKGLPVPRTRTDELVYLKFLIVYHANFGDTDESVRIARQFISVDYQITADERMDLVRKAGLALWLGGFTDEALAALAAASMHASTSGRRRVEFTVALMCAGILTDIYDDVAAKEWRTRAERIADEVPSFRDTQYYVVMASEEAVASWDLHEIQKWYATALEPLRRAANQHGRRWLYALEVVNAHLSAASIDIPAMLENLVKPQLGGDNGQVGDFEMAIALRIAIGTRHLGDARRHLQKYLSTHRHGRQPLSRALHEAMAAAKCD